MPWRPRAWLQPATWLRASIRPQPNLDRGRPAQSSRLGPLRATAADHPDRESARRWLLDYNRGDVEATLAIRNWFDGPGQDLPVVP